MGKVADQINQFTETYSAIVVGMHSDMNQYRREVTSLKQNTGALEEKLYQIVSGAKHLEQSNLKISSKIEDRKSEIENFYREIAGSVHRIKIIGEEVDKATSLVEILKNLVNQSVREIKKVDTRLTDEESKNLQLATVVDNLNLKLGQALNDINRLSLKLVEEQGKNISLSSNVISLEKNFNNTTTQIGNLNLEIDALKIQLNDQGAKISSQKMMIIGVFILFIFILALTILL